MLKGLIRDNELVHKAEWLETRSLHCGIGLWQAEEDANGSGLGVTSLAAEPCASMCAVPFGASF